MDPFKTFTYRFRFCIESPSNFFFFFFEFIEICKFMVPGSRNVFAKLYDIVIIRLVLFRYSRLFALFHRKWVHQCPNHHCSIRPIRRFPNHIQIPNHFPNLNHSRQYHLPRHYRNHLQHHRYCDWMKNLWRSRLYELKNGIVFFFFTFGERFQIKRSVPNTMSIFFNIIQLPSSTNL